MGFLQRWIWRWRLEVRLHRWGDYGWPGAVVAIQRRIGRWWTGQWRRWPPDERRTLAFVSGAGAGSSSSSSDEGSLADDPAISAQYTGGSGGGRITPLVYNPESDGPPVFHSGVWTGDGRAWQVVQVTDKQPGSAQSQESTPTSIAAAENFEDDDPNWREVNRLIDKKTGKLGMWEDRAGGDSTNEAAKKLGPDIVSVLKNIGVIVATEGAPHAAGF